MIRVPLICTLLICNLSYSQNNLESGSFEKKLQNYIPKSYIVETSIEGKLNNDTLIDHVLVIRNPQIRDSVFLLVLFQKESNDFEKNLELDRFVSEYDNYIEIIDNNVIRIKTITPWNGVNSNSSDVKYINNQWFYIGHASNCYDPISSWSNSVDFVTGVYKVKHDVMGKDKKIHTREISGLIDKIGPIPIEEDCSKYMKIKYNGEVLYAFDRCNLWNYSEEELNK